MRHLQFFLSILLVAVPCTAGVIYVEDGGTGDGSSWADAYGYLQDALDTAGAGDEIWMAQGTYYPSIEVGGSGSRYQTFQMKNGVKIYGGFPDTANPDMADRDPNQYETILSGDIGVPGDKSDNCYQVFYHPEGLALDPNAILDGFTITAGNARRQFHNTGGGMYNKDSSPTVTGCTFTGNSASWGGGMYNDWYSSPTVTNCAFTGNSSVHGGGMFNTRYSSPTVTDCTFSINLVEYNGGGMFNSSSSPTVTNCTFSGNSADDGGGMYNSNESSPTVTNCIFSGNSAVYGGGMYNSRSSPKVTNCIFSGNSANASGGGMHNSRSSPKVTNCIFGGNWADSFGGGMVNVESSPTVTNCSFTGNLADIQGGGMLNFESSPTVTNCILWANIATSGGNEIYNDQYSLPSTPLISYCDIAGSGGSSSWDPNLGSDDGGNIDADPLFVNPNGTDGIIGTEDDNLRLLEGSPCIDAGDNSVVDANIPDLDGNLKILDGDGDGEAIVDMGAYEFIPPIEADVHIIPRVINRNNRSKKIIAIVRLPEGINKSDVSDEPFVLSAQDFDDNGIEATWQRIIGGGRGARVFALFDKDEVMNAVEGIGRVEITVTGKLESGRCISGSDTIRIVRPRRRRARWPRR